MSSGLLGGAVGGLVMGLVLTIWAGPISRWNLSVSRGWPNAPKDPSNPPFFWGARYMRVIGVICLIVGLILLVIGLVRG